MVTNKRQSVVRIVWIMTAASSAGCARTLVITQDPFINTANPLDYNKPVAERLGETLEVSIVCVTADDLAKGGPYQRLAPATFSMTAKDFYTDEFKNVPKTALTIRGAKHDGKEVRKSFDFPAKKLFNKDSVIYVFAKFSGPEPQEILPVAPVVFHPPGAYTHRLPVHIGAREDVKDGPAHGQYIETDSKRGP